MMQVGAEIVFPHAQSHVPHKGLTPAGEPGSGLEHALRLGDLHSPVVTQLPVWAGYLEG